MGQRRLTLDNPVFAGKLRYERRPASYARRELHPRTISDIAGVRTPKSQPKHAGVTASKIHAARPKAVRATPRPKQAAAAYARRKRRTGRRFGLGFRVGRHSVLYAMAVVVFAVGVFVSLQTLRTNKQVTAQVNQQTAAGTDADAPPSTTKPTAADVSGYVVAPTLPRYIDIGKMGVHARVFPMGVDSKNQLRSPANVHDAGWYNGSSLPGQAGAMLVDGHVSSWDTNGVFYGLEKLAKGDKVTVTRGDGKVFTYTVVKNERYAANKVNMAALMVSANTALPGLNIISCAGAVTAGTNEFEERQVVYAVLQ
jgi:sortase (surface protein transpeptidase)